MPRTRLLFRPNISSPYDHRSNVHLNLSRGVGVREAQQVRKEREGSDGGREERDIEEVSTSLQLSPPDSIRSTPTDADLSSSLTHHGEETGEYTFHWGVRRSHLRHENDRSQTLGRVMPKRVTLNVKYFDPPSDSIQWDSVNESWEVYWYDVRGKLNARGYSVRKYGLAARREAKEFEVKLKRDKLVGSPKDTSPQPISSLPSLASPTSLLSTSLQYDEALSAWVVFFTDRERGTPQSKSFPSRLYGFAGGKRLAESFVLSLSVSDSLAVNHSSAVR